MTGVFPDNFSLHVRDSFYTGKFRAMACPCEVIVETGDEQVARSTVEICLAEALRIERKFSRYRTDNQIHKINNSQGKPIKVDDETSNLLDFADHCYSISDGLFDITSGVLGSIWQFDGSDQLPAQCSIDALLPLVGWQKVKWENPFITMPVGMQIDLGGIGKEYAVDRALLLAKSNSDDSILINFGGDLHASAPPVSNDCWRVGIEHTTDQGVARLMLNLRQGALATSGDTRRYIIRDGVRYSHILNPKTGWPVENAPHSVTVASDSCTEAGVLATLALLQGRNAEAFLEDESVTHWCQR